MSRLPRWRWALLLVAAVLVVVGAVTAVAAVATRPGEQASASGSSGSGSAAARSSASPSPSVSSSPTAALRGPRPLPSSATATPVSVRIPAIKVSSTLQRLHLGKAGELDPPTDFVHAGWYEGGPVPGQPGPAVLAGHVDNYKGPAVFFDLRRLTAGNQVYVTLSDHKTVSFTVRSVQLYSKGNFPDQAVYGATPDSQLRLITCGGTFDYSKRSYRSNVVVYASRD